jgi:hypothetical protein
MNKNGGKPLVSKDELMAKIEAAIKSGHADDERTGDKWGLFRGLEVAPLSQTMIDLLYDKDDVTEEMLEYVIEQSEENFEYGLIDFTNTHEITSDYLEKLECQMLSEKLYERAEKEMNQYVQNLRNEITADESKISNDSILIRAYKLTIMNEMLIYMEIGGITDTDELRALLNLPNPLGYLYDKWADCDVNIKDNIVDAVNILSMNYQDRPKIMTDTVFTTVLTKARDMSLENKTKNHHVRFDFPYRLFRQRFLFNCSAQYSIGADEIPCAYGLL